MKGEPSGTASGFSPARGLRPEKERMRRRERGAGKAESVPEGKGREALEEERGVKRRRAGKEGYGVAKSISHEGFPQVFTPKSTISDKITPSFNTFFYSFP